MDGDHLRKSLYDYCIENDCEEVLRQWHPSRNESLTPHTVSYGSQKKPWWICEKGHEWQAAVFTRTGGKAGCPYCYCMRPRVRKGRIDLASANPELAAQWHPTKNKGLMPQQVASNSARSVWWLCEHGHEWQAIVKSRSHGTGCPICKRRSLMAGDNDFATTHPMLAREWHPTKNGDLTPNDLLAGTHRNVWWRCEKGHEWQARVNSRTSLGAGCPVCAGKVIIPGENDMASLYPVVAQEWHPSKNESLTPSQVSPYTGKKVWWLCEKGHEYAATVASRTMNGSGCPYCVGKKVLVGFNDLATMEPMIADQWHPSLNGELNPKMVTDGSHKNVWWQCQEGHVWKAVIYSRARGKKCGCPICAGRTSEKWQKRYQQKKAENALQND